MVNEQKPWLNTSGCNDPTAFRAVNSVTRQEQQLQNKVSTLVKSVRSIIDLAGFEVIGRIHIKHKKTGKEFR